MSSKGQLDTFVAKYTTEGQLVWAEGLGGEKRDIGSSIAVNSKGEVFVSGVSRGPGAMLEIDRDTYHACK